MRRTIRTHAAIASIAVLGLLAAGCAEESGKTGGSGTPSASAKAFQACMVTDTGGIDDRSFNASSWEGLTQAKKDKSNISTQYLQSGAQSDYVPNINALVAKKCDIIVTVGFLMGDATKEAATKTPNQKFAIVDYSYKPAINNVQGLVYSTEQAAFLGGYLAAGMSKTGKVATYGGMKLPTVTIFMDGFAEGVKYYNQKKGKDVKVLGWDPATQNGSFTGDFSDQGKGKALTQSFAQAGADIVLPVAGNVGLGSAAYAQQTNGKINLLWVDTDGCVSAQQYCKYFISSVMKGIQATVKAAVVAAEEGSFKGGNFIGNLENDGVALAPFHDWDSQVPSELKSELDQVKADIISGTIKVATKSGVS